MSRSPGENFRAVMGAYLSDRMLWREVPLLAVSQGDETRYGMSFGIGPFVRILERYEQGSKGRLGALAIALKSAITALSGRPHDFRQVVSEMEARVIADGVELPHGRWSAFFASVTGVLNPFVEPFVADRTRDSFHFLAYSVSAREIAMLAPLLVRGHLPIDPKSVLRPISTWRQVLLTLAGKGLLPQDPRYINQPAGELEVHCDERLYTLDGELFPKAAGPLRVRLGPLLHLAVLKTRQPRRRQFIGNGHP